MAEREEVIDAIVEEVQHEVRRSIGERASTTDILRDVLRRRLSPPAAAQEVERLRAALEQIANATVHPDAAEIVPAAMSHMRASAFAVWAQNLARNTLAPTPEDRNGE